MKSRVLMGVGLALLLVSLISITSVFTWSWPRRTAAFEHDRTTAAKSYQLAILQRFTYPFVNVPLPPEFTKSYSYWESGEARQVSLSTVGGLIAVCLLVWGAFLRPPLPTDEPTRSAVRFGRALAAIGYALLCDGILIFVASAGLARAGMLSAFLQLPVGNHPPDMPTDPTDNLMLSILLLMCLAMSILGALFFFANALWDKLDKRVETFDPDAFWGGLWFRMGEAVIFSVVLYITVRCYANVKGCELLPLALLVGMFLKSGETLITGIATRVFAAFTQLVPNEAKQDPTMATVVFSIAKNETPATADQLASLREMLLKLPVKRVNSVEPAELRILFQMDTTSIEQIKNEIVMAGFTATQKTT